MSGEADVKMKDWTSSEDAILYQTCVACGSVQYFQRRFCCVCGSPDLRVERASGCGVVYAISRVVRAATAETRAHVPYTIVLVDAVEGFRMMAHGDNELAIGDNVIAKFTKFTNRLVPYFERTKP